MKKNTATKWIVFAFDLTDNTPKTGDAAQITANVYIDGGGANAIDDTNPAELGAGYYIFDITAAECNGDLVVISPASSTADIQVIGVPGSAWANTLAADLATVDGVVDAIQSDTSVTIPGAMALDATVAKEASLAPLALEASLAGLALDSTVAKEASLAALATAAALAAVNGVVVEILVDTSTTIPGAMALDATVAKEGSLATLAQDATVAKDATVMKAADYSAAPTAAGIADAVWDEGAGSHITSGTTGKALTNAGILGLPLDASEIRGALGLASADLDAQLALLALEASLAPLAQDSTVAKEVSLSALVPLNPADIADAVWDAPTADHAIAGSAGEAQVIAVPTPAEIAIEVWGTVVTGAVAADTALATLYNGWVFDAGVGSGAGAIAAIITVNVGGTPSDGVEVWISTDAGGTNVIAGVLVSDAFGQATFMLDAGTYFLWKQKSGVNFTNPETIIVAE